MGFLPSLRTLVFLAPVPAFLSGCVIYDDDYRCNNDDCYQGGNSPIGGANAGAGNVGGQGEGGAAAACDQSVVVCPCSDASECAEGLDCVDNKCLDGCGFDFECGDAEVCADGQCVDVCNSDGLCGEGYACVGGGCLPDPENPICTTPTDCAGLPCVDGFCTTACLTNADCAEDFLCEAATGTCFPDLGPTPLCGPETACTGEGQTCSAEGFCRYACETVEECKLIDARFDACDADVCKTDEELNPECTLGLPCAAPQVCVSNECAP
jgi:hypothetical protein